MSSRKTAARIKRFHKGSIALLIYDVAAVNLAFFFALWLRFDLSFTQIPQDYLSRFVHFAPIYTVVCIVVFILLGLYNSIWEYASFRELAQIIGSSVITGVVQVLGITLLFGRMPISYYLIGIVLQFVLVAAIRFAYRFCLLMLKEIRQGQDGERTRVMLIGGGAAGRMLLRDLMRAKESRDKIVCIIDDDPGKWGRSIDGVPVVGGRNDILKSCEDYRIEKIYFAIYSATSEQKRDILNICKESGCKLMTMPSLIQFANEQLTVADMKEVAIEDLLGRAPIRIDLKEVFDFISGKKILVTGAGGSIGSELCRQIASHSPRQLILLDIYENNIYDIQLELREKFPHLNLVTLIGSVRDSWRLDEVFSEYRPEIVYHAAAHKHVPLMEDSPCEAIKNNTIGTYKTAYAAMVYGCKRFVLISTDKAVNPTNVMGASKRLCEMVIQTFDQMIKAGRGREIPALYTHDGEGGDGLAHADCVTSFMTEFVAVRFGNVLGSNGSVIPLFKKQIARGGPVTVTHPDIIRYFMTIPEAVSLVLQAGTYAKGGEIYVLDMGEPVKIDTLARNLIKLSGKTPDVDIRIEYTGLRPGEKLYEEKLMAEEGLRKTRNDLIHIGNPIPLDADDFLRKMPVLANVAYSNLDDVRDMIADLVPTYHSPAKVKELAYSGAPIG